MTQTISLTRALVELKRYDSRIEHAYHDAVFSAVKTGSGKNETVASRSIKFKSVDDAKSAITSSTQKISALIENRAKIKAAIVNANAVTKFPFMGKEITIAEAIELKNSVGYLERYRMALSDQLTASRRSVIANDAKLEEKINSQIAAVLGNADKNASDTQSFIETITETQNALHKQEIILEKEIQQKIDETQELITTINNELDYMLSEVNAKTTIEVEL